jgi:hypothetical protein
MSVRMALAKLCACACGGAIIGGGAMQATNIGPRPAYAHVQHHKAKKIVRKRMVRYASSRRVVKRIRRVTTTTTQVACAPQAVTVASQGAPYPLPTPAPYDYPRESQVLSGGGGVPVLVGGSGGYSGGGGFFGGGFSGGGGGGGGQIVVSSTSSGGSTSTSSGGSGGSGHQPGAFPAPRAAYRALRRVQLAAPAPRQVDQAQARRRVDRAQAHRQVW